MCWAHVCTVAWRRPYVTVWKWFDNRCSQAPSGMMGQAVHWVECQSAGSHSRMLCDPFLMIRKGPLMYGGLCDFGVTRLRAELIHSVSSLSRSRSA